MSLEYPNNGENNLSISQQWSNPQFINFAEDPQAHILYDDLLSTGAQVYDPIDEVLSDLFEYYHPEHIDNVPLRAEYIDSQKQKGAGNGVWVYFPWLHTIARYPTKEDYQKLRTSRNRELVSADEQQKLLQSSILFGGLSLGSNIQERMLIGGIGGHFISADTDTISPSNLNRMSASFLDVGSPKIDFVAKRISLSDPWLNQTHLREGIDKDSLERLRDAGVKIELIIDAVDDFDAKYLLRSYAKETGTPLLMATDLGDKVILDVERHDLEDVDFFNGKLGKRYLKALGDGLMSREELNRAMIRVVGMKNLSTRFIESAAEFGYSLPGLPQLGTTAGMAGNLAAIAGREIIIGNDKLKSGTYTFNARHFLEIPRQSSLKAYIAALKKLRRRQL